MGELWNKLLKEDTIKRGWHLARADAKQDFSENLYSTDIYGQDLENQVQETIRLLRTSTYQPHPLFQIEVPKGTLAFRPGAVIPINDRVVLSAVVLLMAEKLDHKLPDTVYSWRVKRPFPRKGAIFRETYITDLPFLKKGTIQEKIDPFDSWYYVWPKFDEETKRVFLEQGYKFLATSDIAAYFENIQLPILRDLLLTHLPNETELINLVFHFMESWCERTSDGRPYHRGIPQGNFISSFLANFFLLPIDKEFDEFSKTADIKYFRYMDDVRIFTKTRNDARLAVFKMARTLRSLHLNVQTAKTRLYDEARGEISKLLIDERLDDLNKIIDNIKSDQKGRRFSDVKKNHYIRKLQKISKSDITKGQKIIGARAPLEDLSLRVFFRWITAHKMIGEDVYIDRLLAEIEKSSNSKLTDKLMRTVRRFPRKKKIENKILKLLNNESIIFPYQEASCLRALRYLSTLSEHTKKHCWKRLRDTNADRYLRMESGYLLSRTVPNLNELEELKHIFGLESDVHIQVAMAMILIQYRSESERIVQDLVFHPNETICNAGKFFHTIQNNQETAKHTLQYVLQTNIPWIICDYMPIVHLTSQSKHKAIQQLLVDEIRKPRLTHPISGVRNILKAVFTRTRRSLKD